MNSIKTYLTEAYAIDDKSILRILTQNKQINEADPNYSYYKKLAKWANENGRQQKVKNIDLNTIELSDRGLIQRNKLITRYTTLGHVLLALKNIMDQEGKYTPNNELSKLVQQTTLEILAGLSGIANTKPTSEEPEEWPEEESTLHAGMDWTAEKARRLEGAKGNTSEILDKFYNDYYSIEYAGKTKNSTGDPTIVAKLKSLDKILIPEFTALGYNHEVNPFAQFLKLLIEHKRDIFDKLTTNTYGAIHNSFISKYITGNMLGNYPEEIATENILFCSDLYNHNGLDIVEYLSLQKQVLASAESTEYADDSRFLSKVFIQQQVLNKNYLENINALFDSKFDNNKVVSTLATNAKLKSMLEIRELYKHLFKTAAQKTVDNKAIEDILREAITQNIVQDLLRYILGQDNFRKNHKKLAQHAKKLLIKLKYYPDDTKLERIQEILADYDVTLAVEKKIADRVIDLLETAGKAKAGAGK